VHNQVRLSSPARHARCALDTVLGDERARQNVEIRTLAAGTIKPPPSSTSHSGNGGTGGGAGGSNRHGGITRAAARTGRLGRDQPALGGPRVVQADRARPRAAPAASCKETSARRPAASAVRAPLCHQRGDDPLGAPSLCSCAAAARAPRSAPSSAASRRPRRRPVRRTARGLRCRSVRVADSAGLATTGPRRCPLRLATKAILRFSSWPGFGDAAEVGDDLLKRARRNAFDQAGQAEESRGHCHIPRP